MRYVFPKDTLSNLSVNRDPLLNRPWINEHGQGEDGIRELRMTNTNSPTVRRVSSHVPQQAKMSRTLANNPALVQQLSIDDTRNPYETHLSKEMIKSPFRRGLRVNQKLNYAKL